MSKFLLEDGSALLLESLATSDLLLEEPSFTLAFAFWELEPSNPRWALRASKPRWELEGDS